MSYNGMEARRKSKTDWDRRQRNSKGVFGLVRLGLDG